MLPSRRGVKVGRFVLLCAILLLSGVGRPGDPAVAGSCGGADRTFGGLVGLSACELRQMYTCSDVGRPPCGYYRGRVLVLTDYPCPRTSVVLSGIPWKGKHIGADGAFINQFATRRWIGGTWTIDPSWLDGKPCAGMMYPPDAPLFANLRDEFREVKPGLYLGPLYLKEPCPRLIGYMCLMHDPCKCANTCPGRGH